MPLAELSKEEKKDRWVGFFTETLLEAAEDNKQENLLDIKAEIDNLDVSMDLKDILYRLMKYIEEGA